MRGIMWFRDDLRIGDNTALFNAAKQCTQGIVAIYILDHDMIKNHDVAPCRVEFIVRGLKKLESDLRNLNILLHVKEVEKTSDIPDVIYQVAKETKSESLFFNKQYEVNESKRDNSVVTFLKSNNISSFAFDDQVIFPPGRVMTQAGDYFKVFTAFKYAWYKQFYQIRSVKLFKAPSVQSPMSDVASHDVSKQAALFSVALKRYASNIDTKLWLAGEAEATKRLKKFIKNKLFFYDQERDFPTLDATSKLSPYLAAGMISPRQCFLMALDANKGEIDTGNKGAVCWMTELIWREFYKHILVAFPRVSKNKAFRIETDNIPWSYNEKMYVAWQQGKTGFPIVDAAMRQLNTTGWMHNRLRMVVGMFLTKNLFLDWRLGEKYFMSHLIDGDFSANNGGWQWCASTGTDAAPYFRIFNTVTQSERFDKEGKFIRQYCPELAGFDNKSIHHPHERSPEFAKKIKYPGPIVDLAPTRLEAIRIFKQFV